MAVPVERGFLSQRFDFLADTLQNKGNAVFLLQEANKLVHGKAGVSDDGPKRALVEFLVVWDNNLRNRLIPAQDDVTSFLAYRPKNRSPKSLDALHAGNDGKLAHTATTRTSKRSCGTGSPSCSRAAV